MKIETARLLLRQMTLSDVEPLVQLWTDPDVTRFMGGPRDPEPLKEGLLEDVSSEECFNLWPVIEMASGLLVGHCGLLDKEIDGRPEVELVYFIARSAWGKGFATEMAAALAAYARSQLGLTRLVSLVEPDNGASRRVAAKVGMHFRKRVVRPGGRTMELWVVEMGEMKETG